MVSPVFAWGGFRTCDRDALNCILVRCVGVAQNKTLAVAQSGPDCGGNWASAAANGTRGSVFDSDAIRMKQMSGLSGCTLVQNGSYFRVNSTIKRGLRLLQGIGALFAKWVRSASGLVAIFMPRRQVKLVSVLKLKFA